MIIIILLWVIVPTAWLAWCGVRVLFYEILKPTARASVTVYPRFSFLASDAECALRRDRKTGSSGQSQQHRATRLGIGGRL